MKRAHEPSKGGVSLAKPKKQKREEVDYESCIICQTYERKLKLNKLKKETGGEIKCAMNARNDNVADRLRDDIKNELWVEGKVSKWHKK